MRFRKKQRFLRHKGSQEIEAILKSALSKRGQSYKYEEWRVFAHWPTAVGSANARQTVPVSLSATGVLWVEVTHAVWSIQLSMMKPTILQKLSELIGREDVVVDIRFRHNPNCMETSKRVVEHGPSDASKSQPEANVVSLSPDDIQNIEATIANINDVELRAALRSLFEAQCLAKSNR